MKTWRMHGISDLRLDEVPIPEVKPGWALLKVKVLQPSVTEVEQLQGKVIGGESRDYATIIKQQGPIVLGHEFCGEVVEIGEGVDNLKVGDRVFHYRGVPCHQCALCRAGNEQYCHNILWWLGRDTPGCLAEYIALPANIVAAVPDSMTDNEVAAMQPLDSAAGKVFAARIEMGDTVAILGQGVMGLNCTQMSLACGAGKVIGIDIRDESLKLASKLGASITINASKVDPIAAVLEITKGAGADVVFECAGGSPEQGLSGAKTLNQSLSMVRDEGRIVQIAHLTADTTIPASKIAWRGIQYMGGKYCTHKMLNYVIDLVASKRIQLLPTITHVLEGIEKVPEAFTITGNKAKYGAINPAQVVVSK